MSGWQLGNMKQPHLPLLHDHFLVVSQERGIIYAVILTLKYSIRSPIFFHGLLIANYGCLGKWRRFYFINQTFFREKLQGCRYNLSYSAYSIYLIICKLLD